MKSGSGFSGSVPAGIKLNVHFNGTDIARIVIFCGETSETVEYIICTLYKIKDLLVYLHWSTEHALSVFGRIQFWVGVRF